MPRIEIKQPGKQEFNKIHSLINYKLGGENLEHHEVMKEARKIIEKEVME